MKNKFYHFLKTILPIALIIALTNFSQAQQELTVTSETGLSQKPIPVSLEGFSGEIESVLKFDLYVQGFSFVAPDQAQYQISGSAAGNVQGTLTDRVAKKALFSRSYTGASLRRQAHALSDDIVFAITGKKGIAQTKIAFKVESGGSVEIYVSDFDGYNPQPITRDKTIVAAPSWVPGRLALCYNSYKRDNPDIYYHDLGTGEIRTLARYGGSNISPSVSPDGTKVAMILSKSGTPDLYVCDLDGSNLKQLTHSPEDESSPCWSPNGDWICFATKINERRVLAKIPAGGGAVQRISTSGVANPTEPDYSPDGKWIAFTSQMGEFDICVIPAGGGTPTIIVQGEDPSWSPNSRTLIFTRRVNGRYVLSVLDVFTKQVKDVARIPGNDSEPAWAK